MNILQLPTFLSFLAFSWLGVYVFLRNRGHRVNLFFALGMGSLALMEFGDFMALAQSEAEAVLFWSRVSLVGECLIPGSWLAFSMSFARKEPWYLRKEWKTASVGVGAVSVFFLAFVPSSLFVTVGGSSGLVGVQSIGKAFYLFFLLSTVTVAAVLEHTVRQSKGEQRAQIRSLILGIGGLFVLLIFTTSQTLLFSRVNLGVLPVISSAFLICNGLIAFSVVRYRLMDVNLYISRFVIYNSLTVLMVGVYLVLVGLATQLVESFDLLPGYPLEILLVFLAILVLFALFLSNPIRWKARMLINKHFYRSRYDYRQEWLRLSEGLSRKLDMGILASTVIHALQDSVGVTRVSLWLVDDATEGKLRPVGSGTRGEKGELKTDQRFLKVLAEKRTPFPPEAPWAKGFVRDNDRILKGVQPSLLVPMLSGRGMVGLILLGKKTTGEAFFGDDIDLLRSAGAQIASAIVSVKLSEELIKTKEMEVFHRLSSFVLHDLKNLVLNLSLLVENAHQHMSNPEFQRDALKTVGGSVEKMEALIARLSDNSGDFRLNLQETNLNEVVSKVVCRTGQNGWKDKADVELDLGSIPSVRVDPVQMETVVGNLLLNAFEALEDDGRITITTKADEDNVILSVCDNGRGMQPEFVANELFRPFKSNKRKGLGIGLYQCKTIAEAHQGRIEVESREGEGSTFRVILPVGRAA